jgi:hypothetical protein
MWSWGGDMSNLQPTLGIETWGFVFLIKSRCYWAVGPKVVHTPRAIVLEGWAKECGFWEGVPGLCQWPCNLDLKEPRRRLPVLTAKELVLFELCPPRLPHRKKKPCSILSWCAGLEVLSLIYLFVCLVVLGFELRASGLLGSNLTTWATILAPFPYFVCLRPQPSKGHSLAGWVHTRPQGFLHIWECSWLDKE